MLSIWLVGALFFPSYCIAESSVPRLIAVYPNLNGNGTDNLGYRVLELALAKSGRAYTFQLHPVAVNDERARAMIESGDIDIADFGASREFENLFSAVYFPIDRGLLGYRLFVIHRSRVAEFSKIASLADLRKLTAGQGLGWSSSNIMRSAGIPVVTGANLKSLFPMLQAGRFDFLPLGLNEVYDFYEEYKIVSSDLVIDTHSVLYYRFARMFYVKHGNTTLRDAVQSGLERAFNDGSFQTLFENDPGVHSAIARAHITARTAIVIENPLMTAAFDAIPEKYFISPGKVQGIPNDR